MKEDILEQLIEDWLISKTGMFVKHNIKFRPNANHKDYNSKLDSVHSDIDILAISLITKNKIEAITVTCKSWQTGFNPKSWTADLEKKPKYNEKTMKHIPREKWKHFRELASDKWTQSFIQKIFIETGQRNLTYYIAVTKLNGKYEDKLSLENSEIIKKRFKKFKSSITIKLITIEEIVNEYFQRIESKETTSLESTDVGRFLQLINAAGLKIKRNGV